jgi:hypothetical protein
MIMAIANIALVIVVLSFVGDRATLLSLAELMSTGKYAQSLYSYFSATMFDISMAVVSLSSRLFAVVG